MDLPDEDVDSVERMIQWMYSRQFDLTTPISDKTTDECYWELARLNTIADKYDIYLLKNRIVDELYKLQAIKHLKPPQIPVIAHVYANTSEKSSFRKLMVAWYTWRIDFEWYDQDDTRAELASAHHDFSIDLAMALGTKMEYPNQEDPFTLDKSVYYEEPTDKSSDDSIL